MNRHLLLTSESGKLIEWDTETHQYRLLYEHPANGFLFGIACHGDTLYFGGSTFLAMGTRNSQGFQLLKTVTPYEPRRGMYSRLQRSFWTKVGAYARAIPHGKPDLHQINIYGSTLYVTATSWNEIWLLTSDLQLQRRIRIQPYIRDYHHVNNVFCDGTYFYVCLNRYAGIPGAGGYAKFDHHWNEVERRSVGWESHALSVIDGQIIQLSAFSRTLHSVHHHRPAGLMVNDSFVFEYDAQQYFCKDFSMDDNYIYVVGGENTTRRERKTCAGIVFVLNRRYHLLQTCLIPGIGGINGCRLPDLDYSNGAFTPTTGVADRQQNEIGSTHGHTPMRRQGIPGMLRGSPAHEPAPKGFTIWFTGRPGSGKSTLARALSVALILKGVKGPEVL